MFPDDHAEDLASGLGVDKEEVKADLENLVEYSVPGEAAKESLRRKYGDGGAVFLVALVGVYWEVAVTAPTASLGSQVGPRIATGNSYRCPFAGFSTSRERFDQYPR